MHKSIKGALLGSLAGAGLGYLVASRSDDAPVDPTVAAATGAAAGAMVGGLAGLGLQWRDNTLRAVDAVRRLTAMPGRAVEISFDGAASALPHVEEFVDRASGSVFEMADAVRPHVETLTGIAREKAFDLAEVAIGAARPDVGVVRYRALTPG